ncbi:hypothetical protein, partial [Oleiphilus sp. HI0132]|uniref:hypothetical protein n=1 Tax=Oleiphilus sp. HI0132 TaxID=1822270 RepID=UPI000A7F9F35
YRIYLNSFVLFIAFFFLTLGGIEGSLYIFLEEGSSVELGDYFLEFSYLSFFVLISVSIAVGVVNLRRILYLTLFFVICSVYFDGFIPGFFSKTYYRAAGFPENPNSSAMIICISVLLLLNYGRLLLKDVALMCAALFAIVLCASRGGAVIFFLILSCWLFSLYRASTNAQRVKYTISLVGAMCVVSLISVKVIFTSELFESERTRDRLSITSQDSVLERDDTRLVVIETYLTEIENCFPMMCGVAQYYNSPKHAHNTSINYAYKYGAPLLFLSMLPILALLALLYRY